MPGPSGRYALDAAVETLPWFNDYFGTPYPLPKLDMIAVPGQQPVLQAMENWGAIMYFEPVLLVDPRLSSHSDRQSVFDTVAHEVAHQWFGNLVTMDWWDDLWLNEGYATWMELKVENALHPERKPALAVVNDARESALRRDAGAATHPVVQPVDSIDAANQAFDAIAYNKGGAVIRMLEDMLGESGFRAGIRRYMKRYAHDNAATDQLWAELAAATGRPVTDIAHDFTLQPGVPLVSVATAPCVDGRTPVTLSQGRFETGTKSGQRVTWRIPVRLQSLSTRATQEVLLGKDGAPVTTSIDGCGPVIVNAGQAGYFRTRYAPPDFEVLAREFSAIAEIDRLGVLNDTWALGEAGELPVTSYLGLAAAVSNDSDPLILMQLADTFTSIDRLFDGSERQQEWRAFARRKLAPVFERIGWIPSPTEGETDGAAAREADPRTRSVRGSRGARRSTPAVSNARPRTPTRCRPRFAKPRSPSLRGMRTRPPGANCSHAPRRRRSRSRRSGCSTSLGRPVDPALASRTLELALSGEVSEAFAPGVLAMASDGHPRLVFDYAVANEKAVLDLVEVSSRWAFIPELAQSSAESERWPTRYARTPSGPCRKMRDRKPSVSSPTSRSAPR